MRDKVRKMWKLCFNDSEEFMDMYFNHRYSNDINLAIESGDDLIASMQMIPYPMTYCGSSVATSYISGACTHPDYRGRGVMRELLSQALGQMHRNDVAFSTLIPAEPWLYNYYAQSGYATAFSYGKRVFHLPDDENENTDTISDPTATHATRWTYQRLTEYDQSAYTYFNKMMQLRPCCLQHTEADFRVILADLKLSDGAVYTISDEVGISALAVAYPNATEQTITVGELLSDTPEAELLLLGHICRSMNADTLHIIMPPLKSQQTHNLGMIRIIQAKPVLQLYAALHPDMEVNIDLADEQLSINNGYYYINKGRCMFSHKRIPGAHEKLTIAQLAEKLFSAKQAYMSLMLN